MENLELSKDHIQGAEKSEERLLALMKATSDVVYRMSPDWKTVSQFYGRGFLEVIQDPDSQWLDKYIHTDDQAFVLDRIHHCIKEKKILEIEHRGLRIDGSIGWTYSRAVPLFDEKGEIKEWIGAASDITERKRAEEEALELIDGFTEGSWIVDYLAGTIKCSEKWSKRIGLDQIPENERLTYTHTLTHPDDTKNTNSIKHCMETGMTRFDLEYRVKTVDRGYIWTQNRGKIVYDGHGKAIKVYAATIDISDRKKTEEELRNSEQQLRLATKAAGMYTWEYNIKTGEIKFSGDVKDLIGFSYIEHDDIFSLIKRYTVPEDGARHTEALLRTIKGEGDINSVNRVLNPQTGEIVWLEAHATLVRAEDGTPQRVVGIVQNINERKRAEEALRKSEELYSRVVENTSAVILHLDSQGIIRFANKHALEFFGYAEEEFVGKPALGTFVPERETTGRDLAAMVKEITAEPDRFHSNNNENMRKSGERVWMEWTNSGIYDAEGRLKEFLAVGIDATERKRAEDALRESEKKALALVAELEAADKNKNHFLSVLSHELRNPLAAVTAGISILEQSEDKLQREKAQAIMKRQSTQLCKLVDDLLDLMRISNNKIVLKKEEFNLNDLVMNAAKDLASEFYNKGVELSVDIAVKPVWINADPVRIAQSVGNLLGNALKFTPKCGQVLLTLRQEQDQAVLRMQDSGVGIDAQMLEHLFEPFIQADDSLDRQNNGGLGLGLSIVKGIVELHDGTVDAYSEGLGKGSVFTIHLPITIDNKAAPNRSSMDTAERNRKKILVIEDSEDLAESFCMLFHELGYQALAAYNGIEGIAKAKQIHPDIIFCDIGLPGMNGYDVAKKMKRVDELKDIYLIALSGYAGDKDIQLAYESGFHCHVTKPVDMTTLVQVLNQVP